MSPYEFVIALVGIVGGCITAWVYMATNKQRPRSRPADPGTRYSLTELSAMAESLQERIDTLEAILDAEVPDWRDQNERATEQPSN
ncbi:MAG: hypothetical protein RLZZ385_2091 [Pseudomonadota bacterium]|jgi:phage shock protein B